MNDEMLEKLRQPFKGKEVGKLPRMVCRACSDRKCTTHTAKWCSTCKSKLGEHIHLDYVGHAHVTERLLQVDPEWNWEPLAFDDHGLPALDHDHGLWIRLTVGGKTVLGYGDAPGKRAAVKELIGDAIRNAAMRLGVALDLWKKEPAAPVAEDSQDAPVLSPEQQANELRNVILAVGRKKKMSLPAIDGDFATWARGEAEFRKAGAEMLEQYKAYLEAVKP